MKLTLTFRPSVVGLELTDEERKTILHSADFVEFLDHSSKILERAMSERYDFMKDYTLGLDDTT